MEHFRLTADDRAFLELVLRATSANPFTPQRAQVDALLVGTKWSAQQVWDPVPAVAAVQSRVKRLLDAGATVLGQRGRDRELLRAGLMFRLFHCYSDMLDAHISAQLAASDPLPVPFAAECLERMRACGFEHEESLRSFAAFFQLRRAFYFLQGGLVGRGASMQRLRAQLWNNVFTYDFLRYERILWNRLEDFALLLLGETGVGKGAAAAAVGRSAFIPFDPRAGRFSQSFADTFIAANLSQYSESLIESELFGHCRGAFTGAIANHQGLLARCKPNGAIFLDEIGDLPATVQLKLLRVLQERTFCPVGSHEPRRFAGRVVAATNRSLEELRAGGRFRDDFYYRLCSDVVSVPTLRQRLAEEPGEFEELLRHMLQRICGDGAGALVSETARVLRKCTPAGYTWPGNVRELEQAVRSVLLNGVFAPRTPVADAEAGATGFCAALAAGTLDAKGVLAGYCRMLYERSRNYGEVARRTGLDRRTVRKYIEQCGTIGARTAAAGALR
ncbi:MAG: sigma 54-interacting transcriptional regulator [Kiritimatiellae bacterium]|nr:sigma 54-interacting transcriptional regulator [Kiritimatiellia bacterium]